MMYFSQKFDKIYSVDEKCPLNFSNFPFSSYRRIFSGKAKSDGNLLQSKAQFQHKA